ncbi:hypothetical protein C6W20_14660 [Bacillus sp. NMCN6]|uniref:DUF5301 domain-containing protein n=1 Tax=Bacillus sp. NMCN6 TaxID=2108535 RepID=UPI000D0269BD|nr:DUF5301 domain-containing protein [Bacillus sp. NMCN6]PRR96873.1 hypothetical protein C6W20_14660 [Bacillus sp. NMCN6]
MKKWMIGLVVMILLGIGLYFMINAKTYSFDDVVLIDPNKVTSIQIEDDHERAVLVKKEEIQKLLKELSDVKLKKTNEAKKASKDSYWIRVYENKKETYGLTFYDQAFLMTYDFSKKKDQTSEYQIVDANQVDIGQYIK